MTINSAKPESGHGAGPSLAPKKLYREIWNALEQQETAQPTIFRDANGNLTLPVYDGRFGCFTAKQLAPGALSVRPPRDERMRGEADITLNSQATVIVPGQGRYGFRVTVQNPMQLDVSALVKWYTGSSHSVPVGQVYDCLAALNTMFHHGPAMLHPTTRNAFFVRDARQYVQGAVGQDALNLGKGLELWRK